MLRWGWGKPKCKWSSLSSDTRSDPSKLFLIMDSKRSNHKMTFYFLFVLFLMMCLGNILLETKILINLSSNFKGKDSSLPTRK